MKLTPFILTVSLISVLPAFAANEAKPAATATTPAAPAAGADAAWAEVEEVLKDPKERPKTRDEAIAIYKAYIQKFDEKGAAFLKAYPTDPRRWTVILRQAEIGGMRSFVGLPEATGTDKLIDDLLAAADVDKDTKTKASFLRVQMSASKGDEAYEKVAEAHLAAYPDYKPNAQIKSELKRIASEKDLKKTPLDLKFTTVDGAEFDLEKLRGKVVLVDFWATWCGPCVAEIPNVVATYNKLRDKGFEIVGLSFDNAPDKEKLQKFTKEKNMPWPQFFDGQGWKNTYGVKYGINSIPRMWLVNKKGLVVDTNGRQDLAAKVEKLLAE